MGCLRIEGGPAKPRDPQEHSTSVNTGRGNEPDGLYGGQVHELVITICFR
jgi:hypothetical protein